VASVGSHECVSDVCQWMPAVACNMPINPPLTTLINTTSAVCGKTKNTVNCYENARFSYTVLTGFDHNL
jgi:hypothetical protein